MKQRRLVVIGGGAAGFFTAIRAAETYPDAEVIILERGKDVLQKVKISGGGRCNVTHACFEPKELVKNYPRGSRELLGPFHKFACGDTMGWFDDRGVETKIEDDGRVFPVTDNSQTIIDCLQQAARRAGVQVLTKQRVERLRPPTEQHPRWQVKTPDQTYAADAVMVAAGSNPRIWQLLEQLGHTVVTPTPSLFTFNTRDTRLSGLAGVSVPSAELHIPGTKLKANGPLLITHWGLSGPGILRLSAWGARILADQAYRFPLRVNWLMRTADDVRAELNTLRTERARQQMSTHTAFDLPTRLWQALVRVAKIPADQQWAQLTKAQQAALLEQLTQATFAIAGKSTFKEEFVTAGGIALTEVDFRTFSSKLHPSLYFAGEVLDIDAITGGFNFQAAWTGGWIAGEAVFADRRG